LRPLRHRPGLARGQRAGRHAKRRCPMIRTLSLTATALLAAMAAQPALAGSAMSAGEYISKLGDCAACHTSEASAPLAGGKGFPTPIGTVFATNITPDKTHGIGNYSLPEF